MINTNSTAGIQGLDHAARKLRFHRIVGENLRAAREKTGMSQKAFALRIGVAPGTINHAEYGTTVPLYLVALYAQTIDDVTIDELVPLVEDP